MCSFCVAATQLLFREKVRKQLYSNSVQNLLRLQNGLHPLHFLGVTQVWTTSSLIDAELGMTVDVLEDAGVQGAEGGSNIAGQLSRELTPSMT